MKGESRKNAILSAICQEYLQTAQPVGSSVIVEKYGFDLSSATIRNEMSALEEEGLIIQPHTSAGRIPSESGWLANFNAKKAEAKIGEKERQEFEEYFKSHDVRQIAKTLADKSGLTVFVGFSPADTFFTGLANLFKQPEFQQINLVQAVTEVVDHLEEVMPRILKEITEPVQIFLGENNPFGLNSGVVITKTDKALLGILGPIRLDYPLNFKRLEYIYQNLK